jgi:hypothetical protein
MSTYRVLANIAPNNNVYPWVVIDGAGKTVAFSVTEHTAKSWADQLNKDGYITAI